MIQFVNSSLGWFGPHNLHSEVVFLVKGMAVEARVLKCMESSKDVKSRKFGL